MDDRTHVLGRRWLVGGSVQGVGFRPFICRAANDLSIRGWVKNQRDSVEIVAYGKPEKIDLFFDMLFHDYPSPAAPVLLLSEDCAFNCSEGFAIEASDDAKIFSPTVLPDLDVCSSCVSDLFNSDSRRFRYLFVQCAQCGPRFSAIYSLPYDRENTSLRSFTMCVECAREYRNIGDRRFHAQNQNCPTCGPQYTFQKNDNTQMATEDIIGKTVSELMAGTIGVVKGLGGYHYIADAQNADAVQQLRDLKRRPHKPFAVMFPDHDEFESLHRTTVCNDQDLAILRGAIKPVVILPKNGTAPLPESIAPGLKKVGAVLPYTPFYHVLMREWAKPMIVTSANISGEPILFKDGDRPYFENKKSLFVVSHNRPIVRAVEDSVLQRVASVVLPLRLGRCVAPLELTSSWHFARPVLALGGHLKNAIALGWKNKIVMSSYVGDLSSMAALEIFEATIEDLRHLYQITPEIMLVDAHPSYAQMQWLERRKLSAKKVFHHRAHASAIFSDSMPKQNMMVFAWDGTGYGEDATLWGGETFVGVPGQWQRVASFRPLRLIGGEPAIRHVRRVAAAMLFESNSQDTAYDQWRQVWQSGIVSPSCSSVGRLFDGAAALTGMFETATYEGHAAMWLEDQADDTNNGWIPLALEKDSLGLFRVDWRPLTTLMQNQSIDIANRAALFHNSLAHALLDQVRWGRDAFGVETVGVSGGVFQNRFLLQKIMQLLENEGVELVVPNRVPLNDNGLAVGQLIECAATENMTK